MNSSFLQALPNMLTGLRFVCIPWFIWLLTVNRFQHALILFLLMGISDALDGFLAKRYSWKTTFGAYLDPLADKAMLVCAYYTLGAMELIPHWLVFIVILRDVILLAGAMAYHMTTRRLEMAPSAISKVNTFMQILLVVIVIYNQIEVVPYFVIQGLIGLTLLTTFVSGVDYVAEWSKRATKDLRKQA